MTDAHAIREQLRERGDLRGEALDTAALELEEILRLAPAALEAGISVSEIGRLGQVGRPTLYPLGAS